MKHRSARRTSHLSILHPHRWSVITWVTVIIRIAAALYIIIHPLAGMLLCFFLDWFDAYLLIQHAKLSREEYHALDKNIDQLWSVIMLLVGFSTPFRWVFLFLFMYRLFGHVLYLHLNDTRVFLFFPNVFEFAFLWFVALAPWGTLAVDYRIALVFHTVLKLIQEVALHHIWPKKLLSMKYNRRVYHPWLRALGWNRLGI